MKPVAIVETNEVHDKLFSLRIINRANEVNNVDIKFDDSLNHCPQEGVSVYVESDTDLSLQDLSSIIGKIKIQVTHVNIIGVEKIKGIENINYVGIPSLGKANRVNVELTPDSKFTIVDLVPQSMIVIDFHGIVKDIAVNTKSQPIALVIKNNSSSKIENFEFLQADKYYPDNRHVGNSLHFDDVTISSAIHGLSYQCILGGIQRMKEKICHIMVICKGGFDTPTNYMRLHQYDIFGYHSLYPINLHKLFFNNEVIATLGSDNNFHLDACTGLQFALEPYKEYAVYIYLRKYSEQTKDESPDSHFGTKVAIL